jgi:hypothetical protein
MPMVIVAYGPLPQCLFVVVFIRGYFIDSTCSLLSVKSDPCKFSFFVINFVETSMFESS